MGSKDVTRRAMGRGISAGARIAAALLAAGAALRSGPAAAGAEGSDADAVQDAIVKSVCAARDCPPCVVLIRVPGEEGRVNAGTGILLKDGRVLTAAHLLRSATPDRPPQVIFGGRGGRPEFNGSEGRSITWKAAPKGDVAAIRGVVVPPWASGVAPCDRSPKKDAAITVVGAEAFGGLRVYAGTMAGSDAIGPHLHVNVTTQRGDSGAPAFDAHGRLVGLVSGAGTAVRTTRSIEGEAGKVVTTEESIGTPATFVVDLSRVDLSKF